MSAFAWGVLGEFWPCADRQCWLAQYEELREWTLRTDPEFAADPPPEVKAHWERQRQRYLHEKAILEGRRRSAMPPQVREDQMCLFEVGT